MLDQVLAPQGVAVMGASDRPNSLPARFVAALVRHGYAGHIAPVNPRGVTVAGVPSVRRLQDAAEAGPIDLVVVGLSREHVEEAIQDSVDIGAAGALIFSSGFGETGPEGQEAERRLRELASEGGMVLLGPNSPGFLNPVDRVCPTALGVGFRSELRPGQLAVIAQSGGVGGVITEIVQDAGVGTRLTICTGNEADMGAGDMLVWASRDDHTRSAVLYLEGIRHPDKLAAGLTAMRAESKPVVVFHPRSQGAVDRAASAHTGMIATDDDALEAFFERYGAERVSSFEQLLNGAVVLGHAGTRVGSRVGVVTTSGGAGIVAADALAKAGLQLPQLEQTVVARLRALAPYYAAIDNPADMSGMFVVDPSLFASFVREFSRSAVDTVVLVLTVHATDQALELAFQVLAIRDEVEVGTFAVLWFGGASVEPARARLRRAGVLVFDDATSCARGLAAASARQAPDLPAATRSVEHPDSPPGRDRYSESEVLALLETYGVPIPKHALISGSDAHLPFPGPYVVKADAPGMLHKSEIGTVRLGVDEVNLGEVGASVCEAARAAGYDRAGIMVQEEIGWSTELLVGIRAAGSIGHLVVVAPGGTDVEMFGRASHALLPLRQGEAEALLRGLPWAARWDGYRGDRPLDLPAAVEAVEVLAAIAEGLGDRLHTLEVNPLLIGYLGDGVCAVDGVLVLNTRDRGV